MKKFFLLLFFIIVTVMSSNKSSSKKNDSEEKYSREKTFYSCNQNCWRLYFEKGHSARIIFLNIKNSHEENVMHGDVQKNEQDAFDIVCIFKKSLYSEDLLLKVIIKENVIGEISCCNNFVDMYKENIYTKINSAKPLGATSFFHDFFDNFSSKSIIQVKKLLQNIINVHKNKESLENIFLLGFSKNRLYDIVPFIFSLIPFCFDIEFFFNHKRPFEHSFTIDDVEDFFKNAKIALLNCKNADYDKNIKILKQKNNISSVRNTDLENFEDILEDIEHKHEIYDFSRLIDNFSKKNIVIFSHNKLKPDKNNMLLQKNKMHFLKNKVFQYFHKKKWPLYIVVTIALGFCFQYKNKIKSKVCR